MENYECREHLVGRLSLGALRAKPGEAPKSRALAEESPEFGVGVGP